jgi:hypothetical protein
MNRFTVPLVAVVVLAATLRALAGDKPAAPLSRAEIDERIYNELRVVIDKGAMIHNNGDPAGCYRIFQGALIAVSPMLDHRPALQTAIKKGLQDADPLPDPSDRAFALRAVLDAVRATIKKDLKPMAPAKEPTKEAPKDPGKDK